MPVCPSILLATKTIPHPARQVFLDLPAPWEAIEHAKKALKVCLFFFVHAYILLETDVRSRKTVFLASAALALAWSKYYAL
jgi:hypothetical protein